jgi:NhaP-type Na+/H+ or K+/H+ antiporter
MFGAVVGSISPAVIVPVLRQLNMQKESRTILFLESAISDVLSIVIALAFLEAYKLGKFRVGVTIGDIISSFLIASLFGIISGFLWSIFLNKIHNIKNAIFTTPAFAFIIFGMVELLGYSGYIASLAFGITMGNVESFKFPLLKKYIPHNPIALNETEKLFFSEVVFLLKTFFFVYVGLSIKITDVKILYYGIIFTAIIFIIRIPVVRFSISKSTSIQDASLMTVMVPKGLAAAVLASVPLQQGMVGGEFIQDITYAVVLFSIVLTSLLVFLVDKAGLSNFYRWIFSGFGQNLADTKEENKKTKFNPYRFE